MRIVVPSWLVLAVCLTALPCLARAEAPCPSPTEPAARATLAPSAPSAGADLYDKARVLARTRIWKDINQGVASSGTVAIMDGGRLVYAEGFGMADREKSLPVQPHTLFNIGSISKVFVATALMQLVDDGKVGLDDPVVQHLPEFRMADPRFRQITLRMLLNHSSGLPGTTWLNNFGIRRNPEVFTGLLQTLAQAHLKHAPGARSPYTNDGFTLAEMVVERVSGQDFLDFLQARVFAPLALADSGDGVGRQPGRSVAVFYQPATGKPEPLEVLSVLGAGGLASTAVDLCRFQDSFSGHGPQILSASSRAEMLREQPSGFSGRLPHGEFTFGLGWDLTDLPRYRAQGIQVLGKSGGTGRYTSMMFTVPEHRISVAVIEAARSGRSMETALALLDEVLIARGLLPRTGEEVTRPLSHQPIPRRYKAYAGYYAPLRKVEFDFKKNLARLTTMEAGEEPRPSELFFHGGSFHDKNGQPVDFVTLEGQDFLVATPPTLGVDVVVGQRLKKLEEPRRLRIDLDGKTWLVRNARWFEGIQGTEYHVVLSRIFEDLPGYVDLEGLLRVDSSEAAGMPVDNIRDLSELSLVDREGTTWVQLSDVLLSPASQALPLKTGSTTLTIGPEGLSEWRVVREGMVLAFDLPSEARLLVFSPEGKPLLDSLMDPGPRWVDKGSLVEFLSGPGTQAELRGR